MLGIIAGSGALPIEVAEIYATHYGTEQVAIACVGEPITAPQFKISNFHIGQVGKILRFLKDHKVKKIVFAGHIPHPDLHSLKVDIAGSLLLAKILKHKILGDDQILTIIAKHLEERGFIVIAVQEILALSNYQNILSGTASPSQAQLADIEYGQQILTTLSPLDVGQAVVVHNRYCLGIEAAEGTDNLIERTAAWRKTKAGGVLVKIPKTTQDMRLDVPAIGPQTIELLGVNRFAGLAIAKSQVIIIDSGKVQQLLLKYKLFIKLLEY